jgi:hypothetical protein
MKANSYQFLVNATGQLMQQHAFDHLSDEKISRMQQCLHRLGKQNANEELKNIKTAFFNLFGEADLFTETSTPQTLYQFQLAMNCFGENIMPALLIEEGVE